MNLVLRIISILFGLFPVLIHCRYFRVPNNIRNNKRPDEKLTRDEYIKTFHKLPGAELEYDFVQFVTGIDALKGQHNLKFNFGHEEIRLRLTPIDRSEPVIPIGTPIYEVKSQGGSSYQYHPLAQTDVRQDGSHVYEDREKLATLLLHYGEGTHYYDGVIGEGKKLKVIRSAPLRFALEYEAGHHFVYEVDSSVRDELLETNNEDDLGNLPQSLEILQPKLLVVVDYTLFRNLDESLLDSMRYLTVLWNAINLKYRSFTKPKVNVKVTGFIFAKDETALKYVYDARNKADNKMVNTKTLLNGCKQHFANDFHKSTHFENYHSVLTMTSHMGEDGVGGTSFRKGICTKNHNMGYFEDTGSYTGVIVGAHELGHLLGMTHDDKKCGKLVDGSTLSMMATEDMPGITKYGWSSCSKKDLEDFAKTKYAECLKNTN